MSRRSPARDALAAKLGGHGLPAVDVRAAPSGEPGTPDAVLRSLANVYGPEDVVRAVRSLWPVEFVLPLPPAARTSDPSTSHAAAAGVTGTPTARNHMGRLLLAFLRWERTAQTYENDHTMTAEDAANAAIPSLIDAEFSKRCSDLQALGYLRIARDADGHERTGQGRSGRQRLVFELTDTGRAVAQGIEVRAL